MPSVPGFLQYDRPEKPCKADTRCCNTAMEPPHLPRGPTIREIIAKQIGVVALQEPLQPCADYSALTHTADSVEDKKKLPHVPPLGLFITQGRGTGTNSEQSPGLINKFYRVVVGIIAFPERGCS
jgi:hypothetical protein